MQPGGPPGWFWGFFVFIFAFGIVGTVLWIWMLVDAVQVPDDRFYRSGSKVVWIVVIAVLQVFGALAYLIAGRPEKEVRARWKSGGDLHGVRRANGATRVPPGGMPPPPPPPPLDRPS
jgi:Phospholipase_D-nuclease N-terminal